eukprot:TRINITY_DN10084_c0_g3_i1.p1 TRINITY_DN10084_c0_g3~~TRINITY_DN10084_c0_g3_i1.p1  ORF type:complete len:514 (+),score=32.49 TRINITY_DN10084_c0_g3_i1:69-1610(+)
MKLTARCLCCAAFCSFEAALAYRSSHVDFRAVTLASDWTNDSMWPLSPETLSKNVVHFFASARNHSDWIVGEGNYCFVSMSDACLLTWVKMVYNVVVAYTNTALLELRLGIHGKPADERYDVVQRLNPQMSRQSYGHLSRMVKNYVKILDRQTTLQMLMSVVFGVSKMVNGMGSAVRALFGQQKHASSWTCFLRLSLEEAQLHDNFLVKSRTWWDANIPMKGCSFAQSDEDLDATSDVSPGVRSLLLQEVMELARTYKITDLPNESLQILKEKDAAPSPACVSVGFDVIGNRPVPRVLHNVQISLRGNTLQYDTATSACRGASVLIAKNEIHKINLDLVRKVARWPDHCVRLTSEVIPSRSFCFPARDVDSPALARAWTDALVARKAKRKKQQDPVSLLMRHAGVLSSQHSAGGQSGPVEALALTGPVSRNGTSLLQAGDALFMVDMQHSNLSQHQDEANRLWRYGAGLMQGSTDHASMERAQEVLARDTKHLMAATGDVETHTTASAATTAG